MAQLCQRYLGPDLAKVLEGADVETGYWIVESTSQLGAGSRTHHFSMFQSTILYTRHFCSRPELSKLFQESSAFRLVGRVRLPREEHCGAVVELAFRGTEVAANWLTNVTLGTKG